MGFPTILPALEGFCRVFGHEPVVKEKGVSTEVLCHYAVWLAASDLTSIRGYISMGPRVLCEMSGEKWQNDRPKLKRVIRAIERVFKVPPARKAPITIEELQKLAAAMERRPDTEANRSLWAAIVTAFFSFIRKANYTVHDNDAFDPEVHLTADNIITRANSYHVKLHKTKTVQFGQREVEIPLPKLNDKLCPHRAIDRLSLKKRGKDRPLFVMNDDGAPMTRNWFSKEFKKLMKEAGIKHDDKSPHSLRRL